MLSSAMSSAPRSLWRTRARAAERASAAADGGDAVVGFDHVAGPGEHERMIPVGYKEHSLQLAEELVAPPVLGEFHGGADQVAAGLFEVGVEAFEQGKGVRRGPGESGDDLIFIHPPDFLGGVFHNDALPHGHLPVADEGDVAFVAHGEDGGSAKFHE